MSTEEQKKVEDRIAALSLKLEFAKAKEAAKAEKAARVAEATEDLLNGGGGAPKMVLSAKSVREPPFLRFLLTDKAQSYKILGEPPTTTDKPRVRYNIMRGVIELDGAPIDDRTVRKIGDAISQRIPDPMTTGTLYIEDSTVRRTVAGLGDENAYHPVVEYLDGLPQWDGVERAASLLDALGVAEIPTGAPHSDPSNASLVQKFLIASVARPLKPGSKVDNMLILQGAEGEKKTTAMKALYGDWHVETTLDAASKDFLQVLHSGWAVEMAELTTMLRAYDQSSVRQVISATEDTYRPPYAAIPITAKRQGVLVGTCNPEEFLRGAGEDRRYWILCVESMINLAWIKSNRDQIWAEALHRYKSGESWWLESVQEKAMVERRRHHKVSDPWEHAVEALFGAGLEVQEGSLTVTHKMEKSNPFRASEVLTQMGFQVIDQDMRKLQRITDVLKMRGAKKSHKETGNWWVW